MIPKTDLPEQIQQVFASNQRGVVGLVDDLLGICRDQELGLDFADGLCRVHPLGLGEVEPIEIPLPKSVFRAVIARLSLLCQQENPGSITPYRGEGDLHISSNPPAAFHVAFTNTASDQRLELRFLSRSESEPSRFTVLLRDNRTITVYGDSLRLLSNASNPAEPGSYGVLARLGDEEVLVALFRVSEVIGVFKGEMAEPVGNAMMA